MGVKGLHIDLHAQNLDVGRRPPQLKYEEIFFEPHLAMYSTQQSNGIIGSWIGSETAQLGAWAKRDD